MKTIELLCFLLLGLLEFRWPWTLLFNTGTIVGSCACIRFWLLPLLLLEPLRAPVDLATFRCMKLRLAPSPPLMTNGAFFVVFFFAVIYLMSEYILTPA